MGQPAYSTVHKLLSYFLLAVMLFVQAVKVGHTHATAGYHVISVKPATTTGDIIPVLTDGNAHHCNICDYELTKDAVPMHSLSFLPLQQQIAVRYKFLHTRFLAVIHQAQANKGPPSARPV